MNFLKKSIYALSLVGMAGLWSCSQDEMLQDGNQTVDGQTVRLTLTVNRGDAQTRTVLSENNQDGGLRSEWEKGDILYVYNTNGDKVGSLAIESGWDSPVGVFSGTVEGVTDGQYVSLFHHNVMEGMVSEEEDDNAKYLKIDLSEQGFSSVSDLAKLDILTSADPTEENPSDIASVQLSVKEDGTATVMKDVTLQSKLAFARFSLSGLDEGSKGNLYITDVDGNLYVNTGLAFGNMSRVKDNKSADGMKIANVEAGKDVFVAFVPNARADVKGYTLKLRFVNDSDGKEYTYQFEKPTTLEAGKYYNSFDESEGSISGIPVSMVPETSTDPGTPGDDDLVGPVFEVDGKKFRFTRANLQFNTSTKEYLIPEKQTDFTVTSGHRIGWTNTTTGNPEYVGLFRWGATGIEDDVWQPWPADYWASVQYYQSAANIHGSLPCQTSANNATISTNSTLCPNGVAQDTPYDWGMAYSRQKNDGSHYFTLTSKELISVIDDNLAVCGTVDGIEGLVILPYDNVDDAKTAITAAGGKYNANLSKLPKTQANDGTNYGSSDRSKFAWTYLTLTYDQLTALNGVFLPAAGMNNPSTGSNPKMVSSDYKGKCYYWTSTPTTTPNAVHLYVTGESTVSNRTFKVYGYGKGYGLSVRLVKEVKE